MKKTLSLAVVVITIAVTMLIGCGKKVECDFCHENKRCKTEEVLGKEINYCKDCENLFEKAYEAAGIK